MTFYSKRVNFVSRWETHNTNNSKPYNLVKIYTSPALFFFKNILQNIHCQERLSYFLWRLNFSMDPTINSTDVNMPLKETILIILPDRSLTQLLTYSLLTNGYYKESHPPTFMILHGPTMQLFLLI